MVAVIHRKRPLAPGNALNVALEPAGLADLVVVAAVLEHERGASWEQIAEGAHLEEARACERWKGDVRVWTAPGVATGPRHPPRRPGP
ncbi:hypothetical protein [Embleya sp. NPDC050493]|uniref:hypothetical protein n=1 Tax=Embleya sp. NPDC050493 TaxID=3363989 RepID=UPI003793AD8E